VGLAGVDVLAALHREAFDEPWSALALLELLVQSSGFALLAQGEPAQDGVALPLGFILCRIAGGTGEVLTLAVLPAARKQGVATALVRAAIVEAVSRGAEAIFLEVGENNDAARSLYAREGFVLVGRRSAYYRRSSGGSTDALVLRRAIAKVSS
jgi:ribosomal-protein-alanine N-acetyltransferase